MTPELWERVPLEVVLEDLGNQKDFESAVLLHGGVPAWFRQWLHNLYAERQLERQHWITLIHAIVGHRPQGEIPSLIQTCIRIFQELIGGTPRLCGVPINVDRTILFGRMVSRSAYVTTIMNAKGCSRTAGEALLSDMVSSGFATWEDAWLTLPVGRFVVWATTREDEKPDTDPFDALPGNPELLRCMLGLVADTDEQLLFVYTVPESMDIYIPTIVEAYAAGPWTVHFRPAEPGARFGRAMPRHECQSAIAPPEVVHRPVMLASLSRPIRTV